MFRNYGAPENICIDNVRRFAALGGLIGLGNDFGGGPGEFETGIPMYEIDCLSRAGLTPMQIIQTATSNAARICRLEKELGTLEPGKLADVLIVKGNPPAESPDPAVAPLCAPFRPHHSRYALKMLI